MPLSHKKINRSTMSKLKLFLILILGICTPSMLSAQSLAKEYSYIVEAQYPHDTESYTQGLQIVDGELYESTGLYGGRSKLMRVDLRSGKATKTLATLPKEQFGEGITILGDTIYMLTWRENILHLFHRTTGQKIDQRIYAGEGWGVTSDGDKLYMSNGSSSITVRDRVTFDPISQHVVTLNGSPLKLLNELEWIEGRIWANIYTTDKIAIINPSTWQVEAMIDLTGLLPQHQRTKETDVLNGIAYDEATKKIYITGKLWNTLFEIKLIEK